MSDSNIKFFSVEGVEALIPVLETKIKKIQDLRDKILHKQLQIDTLLIVGGSAEPTQYSLSQKGVQKDVHDLNALVEKFNQVVQEMNELGCQLKDPDLGLVDFFHIRDDKIVNLCWKSGETKIEHWHTLETGFTARQRL